MKVPSFSLTVTKYLTFQLSEYFLWTIKINCRRFLGRLSSKVMTLLFIQIHSIFCIQTHTHPIIAPVALTLTLKASAFKLFTGVKYVINSLNIPEWVCFSCSCFKHAVMYTASDWIFFVAVFLAINNSNLVIFEY